MKGRRADRVLHVLLTPEEDDAVRQIAKTRGLSLRDLVVSAILGSKPTDAIARLCQLEARVALLEGERG